MFATARTRESAEALRDLGAVPVLADLDDPASLFRIGGLAPVVVHAAPPPNAGRVDTRTQALLPRLHGVGTLVYLSTTGVYGDADGAAFDETRPVAPATPRAVRRVDAEDRLRRWARRTGARLAILRVPGIYASDRLPVERIRKGMPVLAPDDDVHTNHVHADDLARIVVAAIRRGGAQRVFHASDDSALKMGDWFDLVADAHDLPRPERVARADIAVHVAPATLSFMNESRRLLNHRMKAELGVRLHYPTVREGVATRKEEGPHEAGLLP